MYRIRASKLKLKAIAKSKGVTHKNCTKSFIGHNAAASATTKSMQLLRSVLFGKLFPICPLLTKDKDNPSQLPYFDAN